MNDLGFSQALPRWLVARITPWAPQLKAIACVSIILAALMFVFYPTPLPHWFDRLNRVAGFMAGGVIIYAWWPASWRARW